MTHANHQIQNSRNTDTKSRLLLNREGYLKHQNGDKIDLDALLTEEKASVNLTRMDTGILRVSGILPGSFLVVDTEKKIQVGDMVYVRYNGDLLVRRILKENGTWVLKADDPREPVLPIQADTEIEKMGVVIWAINKMHSGYAV